MNAELAHMDGGVACIFTKEEGLDTHHLVQFYQYSDARTIAKIIRIHISFLD